MLINSDTKIKENKQLSNEKKEDENYFAKIVKIRLYHRKRVKKFSIFIFISQSIYFIFGVMFFVSAYIIYILLKKGGLKRRLQYDIYILLILEVINICFSLYSICAFRNILILFSLYFVHSTFALALTIIYFILIKKSCKSENLFFLSIERLTKYLEYIEEFQKAKNIKKK